MFYQFGALIFKSSSYIGVIISILLITVILHSTFSDNEKVKFESFYVVSDLKNRGYSSEVVIRKIIDEIQKIRLEAKKEATIYSQTKLASDISSYSLDIPGTGLSLQTIITLLRDFFNISPHTISGELTKTDKEGHFQFTIRSSNGVAQSYYGDINQIINHAAKYIFKNLEPLTLALYFDLRGDYDELNKLIEYVHSHNQNNNADIIVKLMKSYHYYGKDDLDNALLFAKKAYQRDKSDMFALGNLGYLYLETEQYQEALNIYKKMLTIAPTEHPSIYTNVAEILLNQQKTDDALSYIEIAHQLDPSDSFIYMLRGEYFRRKENLKKAEEEFAMAVKLYPEIAQNNWYIKHYQLLQNDLEGQKIPKPHSNENSQVLAQ